LRGRGSGWVVGVEEGKRKPVGGSRWRDVIGAVEKLV